MIAKKFRVPRQSIDFILKKGSLEKSTLFLIRFVKNNEAFNRFSLVVSKKIYKRAVDRNKLRRQIYEAIRLSEESPDAQHFDFIFIPKKKIIDYNYSEIEKDISKFISWIK